MNESYAKMISEHNGEITKIKLQLDAEMNKCVDEKQSIIENLEKELNSVKKDLENIKVKYFKKRI